MTADSSAAGGVESFVTQDVDCPVAGGAEGSVAGGTEYFGHAFLVSSTCCHPSLLHTLPHFCKWGNVVPRSISLWSA